MIVNAGAFVNETFTLTRIQDDGINSVDGFNTAGYIMQILYFISVLCESLAISDLPDNQTVREIIFSYWINFGDVDCPNYNSNSIFGQNWQNDRGRTSNVKWCSSSNRKSKFYDATW